MGKIGNFQQQPTGYKTFIPAQCVGKTEEVWFGKMKKGILWK